MSAAAVPAERRPAALTPAPPRRLPPVPWRDPHTVTPEDLAGYIRALEAACEADPGSADLRTCLGVAHAMNFDVYRSMDALETAVQLEPVNFYAQLKYAELLYRIRALGRAEEETRKAIELAAGPWELSLARKQLQEIRRLSREGTQKPAWTKPLLRPALLLVLMTLVSAWLVSWK